VAFLLFYPLLFIIRVVVGNTMEVLVPYIKLTLAQRNMRLAQENKDQELSLVRMARLGLNHHPAKADKRVYMESCWYLRWRSNLWQRNTM